MVEVILTFDDGDRVQVQLSDDMKFEDAVEMIKTSDWFEGENFSFRTSSIDRVQIKSE